MSRWLVGFGLVLLACGSNTESVKKSVCVSETRWTGDNEGSAEMRPGHDCLSCHAQTGGPRFAVAGTVYGDAHQSDDCFGLEGASVRITGADGTVTELGTNGAGNFYAGPGGEISLPYTVAILYNGQETKMITPQTELSCNSCHTKTGANNAPGRITPTNAVASQ